MKLQLKVVIVFLTLSFNAEAFDRLVCRAELQDYKVENSLDKSSVVLSSEKKSFNFSEKESETLIIKDLKNKELISVFPWNGIDFGTDFTSGQEFEKLTDGDTWFELQSLKDPKQHIHCKHSF